MIGVGGFSFVKNRIHDVDDTTSTMAFNCHLFSVIRAAAGFLGWKLLNEKVPFFVIHRFKRESKSRNQERCKKNRDKRINGNHVQVVTEGMQNYFMKCLNALRHQQLFTIILLYKITTLLSPLEIAAKKFSTFHLKCSLKLIFCLGDKNLHWIARVSSRGWVGEITGKKNSSRCHIIEKLEKLCLQENPLEKCSSQSTLVAFRTTIVHSVSHSTRTESNKIDLILLLTAVTN